MKKVLAVALTLSMALGTVAFGAEAVKTTDDGQYKAALLLNGTLGQILL